MFQARTGTTWSGSPRAVTEEPTVQWWLRPEGATAMDTPTEATEQSCNLWGAVCSGVGGLRELHSWGAEPERRPCGMELCWGGAKRAVARGKPTQDQFGKDNILWEGTLWNMGRE